MRMQGGVWGGCGRRLECAAGADAGRSVGRMRTQGGEWGGCGRREERGVWGERGECVATGETKTPRRIFDEITRFTKLLLITPAFSSTLLH